MKRILIVDINYSIGGIRKSLDNLIKVLSEDNLVDLFFFVEPFKEELAWINNNVKIIEPDKELDSYFIDGRLIKNKIIHDRIFYGFHKLMYKIKRHIFGSEKLIKSIINKSQMIATKYDVAISYSHDNWSNGGFSGGCNYFVLNKVMAKKKYAWIHGEMFNIGLDTEKAFATYSGFDKVINVSKACDDNFKDITNNKIPSVFIYNLFDVEDMLSKSKEAVNNFLFDAFTFVTVGRIHPVKRIDRINTLSKRLKDSGYSFKWIVVGDGNELEQFKNHAKQLQIDNCVFYVGADNNPYKYISKSNAFVLLSDSESFSIVLNEALILNIPVITTDFPAAHETVIDGVNGFIVERNEESIFQRLVFCLENQAKILEIKKRLEQINWGFELEKKSKDKIFQLINE